MTAVSDSGPTSAALALATAWSTGKVTPSLATGVYGRICFLRPERTHLVQPWVPCAFVADGAFWASLAELGLGARAMLNRVGLEDEIINQELEEGTTFSLALFDEDGGTWRADWAGVMRAVRTYFPSCADKLEPHWSTLQSSWRELWVATGEKCSMSPEQFLGAEDTPASALLFLYSNLNVTQHFRGDGYTELLPHGGQGPAEYFATNRTVDSLPFGQIIPLEI
mmetsp:Transcript_85643/g.141826  ORF Transcript_85643/g.141826 Transcript_85643/m.141826 type:complete len:224 (+) Transcript_85643:54-725(+)